MNENPYAKEIRDITLGALLHDIGKLVQRADPEPTSKTHQRFGSDWLERFEFLSTYSGYALWHHSADARREKVPSVMIVNQADMLAAGERSPHDEENPQEWARDALLLSIFSKIKLCSEGVKRDEGTGFAAHYYPLKKADEVLFPVGSKEVTRATRDDYAKLLEGLEKDLRTVEPIFSVNILTVLLEKYLSFVPGDTRVEPSSPDKDPDISLFDHMMLTAAIASCIYAYLRDEEKSDEKWSEELIYNSDEKRFLIVDVDISGIQAFIYNISSKGALRSLRARSFYLDMACENIANRILKECGLERTNLIYSGGGRARLLLPNILNAKSTLKDVEEKANLFFRKQFGGGAGVNLAWEEFSASEMMGSNKADGDKRDYPQVLAALGSRLEARKSGRISEEVMAHGFDILGPFEPGRDECRVCHVESDELVPLREVSEDEEELLVCRPCKGLYELGAALRSIKKVWIAEGASTHGAPSMPLPFGHLLWRGAENHKGSNGEPGVVLCGRWEMDSYDSHNDYGLGYPHYREGEDFADLAGRSCGEHWLGVLRMDVDDLGAIFREGIEEGERSFSRISVLSRMMNRYFREILPKVLSGIKDGCEHFTVLENPAFPRALEIVYAGGDDLFIVGAWSDLVEAAFDISSAFKLYTCNNPSVHISGGLFVGKPDHPLSDLARLAELAEERAKRIDAGKNRIDLFGRPARWSMYEKAVDSVLLPLLNLKEGAKGSVKAENGAKRAALSVSRGFLRQIMSIALRYEGLEIRGVKGKLAFPYLAYVIARAKEGLKKSFESNDASKARWDILESSLFDPDMYEVIYAVATWADLLVRGGEVDE